MTEVKIQVPEGYELKQTSEGKWELVKKEEVTLKTILKESRTCDIHTNDYDVIYVGELFANTREDIDRLIALSQLKCVADYLNEGWKPNWNNNEEKWHIEWYEYGVNKLRVDLSCTHSTCGEVVFKSEELAEKAIEICGEELLKAALGYKKM